MNKVEKMIDEMEEVMEDKIKLIIAKLKKYNEEYYTLGKPSITDEDYDLMKQSIKDLVDANPQFEDLTKDVLGAVGSPVIKKGFVKATHKQEMLSLDACYDINGFEKWRSYCNNREKIEGMRLSIQPKLDGLSIELIYKHGELAQAITRGNGKVGEDVTENIKATGDVPLKITGREWGQGTVSVVGEVLIHKSDFDKYLAKDFANPRNAAVGSLKQLDSSIVPSRHLKVYCFDIKDFDSYSYNNVNNNDYKIKLEYLSDHGFRIIPFAIESELNEVATVFKNMTIWRDTYDFEMDGLVIKIDDSYTREKLGNKSSVPVWATAWKFNSMVGQSEVEKINWSISKYGTLTPVAQIKPINIGGVTVTNVNLHNFEFATKTLDIKIGDIVNVRRAGDVIPEIVSVDTLKRKTRTVTDIVGPSDCPYCGDQVKIVGINLMCPNYSGKCNEQVILKLNHFGRKEAMDIEGLSTETLRVLVEQHGIKIPKDLYEFDLHKLNGTAGFGAKKIANIEKSLKKSKYCTKEQFMYSMAIPEVGRRASKSIIDALSKMNNPMEFWDLDRQDIMNLHIANIGDSIASSIHVWNAVNKTKAAELADIMNFGTAVAKPQVQTVLNAPLDGDYVMFTGALNAMALTRKDATEKVMRLGGITTTSMSTATILIVGDKPGSKVGRAVGRGVRLMYEPEFETMCNRYRA